MFCMHCGSQLPDGSKFCLACGANLQAVGDVVNVNMVPVPVEVEYANDPSAQEDPYEMAKYYAKYLLDNRIFAWFSGIIKSEEMMSYDPSTVTIDSIPIDPDGCDLVTRELDDLIEDSADLCYDLYMSKGFTVLSKKYLKKYSSRIKNMRKTFAPYGNDEIPILALDATVFGSGKKGLLLTNQHCFVLGTDHRCKPVSFSLGELDGVGCSNGNLIVNGIKLFVPGDFADCVDIAYYINMFVDYCLFLETSEAFSSGSFMKDFVMALKTLDE